MPSIKSREYSKKWQAANREKCAAASARYRKRNPNYQKVWASQNKHRSAIYRKRHRAKNPEKAKEAQRNWRKNNLEKSKAHAKKFNDKNRKKISAKEKEKYWTDIAFRMRKILRSRFRLALVRGYGKRSSGSSIALIGCDIQFLMGYLEARFKTGMKWSNYGIAWEIDHRIPCASFDLTDESHQRSCFHYSNLQPLFIPDNRTKRAALPSPHQAELL